MKKILSGKASFEANMKGINAVADIVKATLGPKGKNAMIDKGYGAPVITNDGVSIAHEIQLEDENENQAAESIKEVALKTNESCGDGTTTSIVLAQALVHEGLKYPDNAMEIKDSLNKAVIKAVDELKKLSRPIKTNEDLLNVATISSESKEIGSIITSIFKTIGKEGVITVEDSQAPYIETEIVEGYQVEKGFATPYMINAPANRAEYQNVKTFCFAGKIQTVSEIMPFLEKVAQSHKEMVIFCDDIDLTVLSMLVQSRQKGSFNSLVVKCASQRNEILEDIATITGARLVSRETDKLETLDEKCLGTARSVGSNYGKTVIIGGKGKTASKIKYLKNILKQIKNENEYDLIEKRIARLKGGVAVIKVGAKTESEAKYLKLKIEDAVNATKSALEEGIVEGGGMTLRKIAEKIGQETVGEKILSAALKYPLKIIIENAGKDYVDILLKLPKGKGYDAKTDTYVDMIKNGIIDPTKVERCSIENSVSFAGIFLTTMANIANKKEPIKE